MNCSAFFVEDPSILVKEISDFFPFHARARRCTSVALNSFTRFGLLLGVILSVIKGDLRYLVISMLFPLLAAAAWYGMQSKHTIREGFAGNVVAGTDAANKVVADVIGVQERTLPNAPNPFMSVLSNEINNNPSKPPAVYVNSPAVKKELDQFFEVNLHGDPGDVFQRNQSQRQFISPPSTSVPNDSDSYMNWLYRVPGKTCREGNSAVCVSRTDSGRYPHLS
jgi:hypothetical protein